MNRTMIRGIQKLSILLLVCLAVLNTGCIPDKFPINYEEGTFPDSVINLEDANSQYDDYNTNVPPTINRNFPLVFSSNRFSAGDKFDLVDYTVFLQFDQHDGTFDLIVEEFAYPFNYLVDLANSGDHEFGPINGQFSNTESLFCFASDKTGNMEIYTSYWTPETFAGVSPMDPTPFRIQGVNSPAYDAYPTFTMDFSKMIFTSNRDGNLDFYSVDLPSQHKIVTWIKLSDTTYTATPVEALNSPEADVCPYINGQVIVFTSKRAGGYGGYDLWYAELTEDGFGEPQNFGPSINTEHNEFRPVLIYAPGFTNDLLIFSSDRPGGKGGYDLYFTGVERMTKKD